MQFRRLNRHFVFFAVFIAMLLSGVMVIDHWRAAVYLAIAFVYSFILTAEVRSQVARREAASCAS